VTTYLDGLLRGLVSGTVAGGATPPADTLPLLDQLLSKVTAKRDAALINLATAVVQGSTTTIGVATDAQRTISKDLADILSELKIERREESFQTVAKGTTDLLSLTSRPGPGSAFSPLLRLAEAKQLAEVEAMVRYMAECIAATARDLPPLPQLDHRKLSFDRVAGLLDDMLGTPSQGVFEQFVFASLLGALADDIGGLRVSTQHINAADASSGAAADVGLWQGGRLIEAYEVTAADWTTKIPKAARMILDQDLSRAHIVVPEVPPTAQEIRAQIEHAALPAGTDATTLDLSVLDVRHEMRSMVHRLPRLGRLAALTKLYEHLVERQSHAQYVVRYVDAVTASDATA
jgi:hypothetical protein